MRFKKICTVIGGVILYTATSLFLLLSSLSSCGIYAIDKALKAPYSPHMDTLKLYFTADDEANLLGYNIWYKVNAGDLYKRCDIDYDSDGDGDFRVPTIDKNGSGTMVYQVDVDDLYPQDLPGGSFLKIYEDNGTQFYFAVSSYGIGIAESGKTEFGRWPY